MNLGEVTTLFKGTLNRRDLTDSLASLYVRSAIARVARILRHPGMEQVNLVNPDTLGRLEVPGELLDLIEINPVAPGDALQRVSWSEYRALKQKGGGGSVPTHFVRRADRYYLWPVSAPCEVWFYREFQPVVIAADENVLTKTAPDLINYSACADACAFFVDDRASAFDNLYTTRLSEIMDQAASSEIAGGSPVVSVGTDQEL